MGQGNFQMCGKPKHLMLGIGRASLIFIDLIEQKATFDFNIKLLVDRFQCRVLGYYAFNCVSTIQNLVHIVGTTN